ncbi:hypothetical protein BV22DRAFT_1083726 [Leucogyrophana mollusca]|uniref:Uncharacterized protein n=1 Tax=Leucogyrophana mollusca TaxID=85980 RepID=A0ACB8BS56_9AGAM|nr:hypothetical protein BV22DRAFT_1083726 [Leucogyrophana mollusca]
MLPVANLQLRDLYDTTVEFFASRSPAFSFSVFSKDDTDSDPSEFPPTPSDTSPLPDLVATLEHECAFLREKLDVAERTHCHSACSCRSSATASLYSMRREHDATKNELSRAQAEISRWEDRCKLLERTLKETRDLVRVRDLEIESLRKDKERMTAERHSRERAIAEERRRSQDTTHARSNSSQSLIRLSADWTADREPEMASTVNGHRSSVSVDSTGSAKDNMSSVSDEERAHMRSMENFLTKTDLWSGAQVIQAVQDLNSEILQFAASATELCTFTKQRSTPTKLTQTTNEVATRLGPALSRILSTRDHSQDPMLVQLALQGCISFCISRALSSFCIGYQSKANITLTQIYTHMFQSEPQPTSSRWRALTHKHIHEIHPELDDYAVNEMTETIFRWSLDIFVISGSTNPQQVPSTRETFRNRFGAQVRRISKAACRLAQVTREEIMSTNFEVVAVDNGKGFDALEMSDAFEDYGSSKGVVLCTTELGLRCSTRKPTSETAGPAEEGSTERRLLLRPKVVLESAVDVIDPR